ncbi:baseplate J-like protein [Vibrio crassostreae]|uniref:baseplate J/gp47 family protein n=1 Tax=Vibrio crassostreae TaxID=246167 RepID=UPI0010486D54|nr:baseplate J/gp47 family protein [Vibrio crassostreae]CAH6851504.1 Baseplate_J domain-containing protein [Vibrio chagasii]TCT44285.1 baseplate J-like protein [Vibrio crassostreae]CAH6863115.1 Baseplate_J domain-containing protein [Vibrio chagasii]CAH6928974.1 Baseplate_J domain-containing protein [Vibrio chagasii]CAH6948351.1 Baseplate_J domain-containing protein [Vibrio chagasii]
MSVYDYVTSNGVIIPDASEVREQVEAEWRAIAGDDVIIDPAGFEGRMIESEITNRMSVARNNARLANQINPNQSVGVFFDSLYALMSGERRSAEYSIVECLMTGVAGTVVGAGSEVRDINGVVWILQVTVTIGEDNTVTGSFRAESFGTIFADIGEITQILTGILGWETVTNETASSIGRDLQSAEDGRRQRKNELGKNARNNSHAIIAEISSVNGVLGMNYRENNGDEAIDIDGVTLVRKSTWVCVDGGDPYDIADAYMARSGGTAFNGEELVMWTDPISTQVIPVQFDRPTDVPLTISITVRSSASVDIVAAIRDSVINYANGNVDGMDGFTLGMDVSAFDISSAVRAQLPYVFVLLCEIGIVGGDAPTSGIVPMQIFEKPTVVRGNIEVIIDD